MSDSLREAAEDAISACLVLLPLEGDWQAGYRPAQRVHLELRATQEEWAEAALAIARLHSALTGVEYEWRAVEADHSFPTGTFRERARAEEWSARTGGYLQRRIKAGEWERLP